MAAKQQGGRECESVRTMGETRDENSEQGSVAGCWSCEQLRQCLIPYIQHDNHTKGMTFVAVPPFDAGDDANGGTVVSAAAMVVAAIDVLLGMDDESFLMFVQKGCRFDRCDDEESARAKKKGKQKIGSDDRGSPSVRGSRSGGGSIMSEIAMLIDAFLRRRRRFYDDLDDVELLSTSLASIEVDADREDELDIKMLALIHKVSCHIGLTRSLLEHDVSLLDLTHLMDIAAIYGTHNQEIVSSVFAKVSSWNTLELHQELKSVGSIMLDVRELIDNLLYKSNRQVVGNHDCKHSINEMKGIANSFEAMSINEVMSSIYFLTDTCVTFHAMCSCYHQAAALFLGCHQVENAVGKGQNNCESNLMQDLKITDNKVRNEPKSSFD